MTPATRQDAATADYHAWLAGTMPDAELERRSSERIELMLIAAPICDPAKIAELAAGLREPWPS